MMMIDACEGFILPIWFVLGWICGWDVVKSWLSFAPFLTKITTQHLDISFLFAHVVVIFFL
jgi:hypothetical protein